MLEDINITNNTSNKPRAVVIARVSSREQENGQLIDAQLENFVVTAAKSILILLKSLRYLRFMKVRILMKKGKF